MKRFLVYFTLLIVAWTTAKGQTTSQVVPGGKVYQTTVVNGAYKFDHADYSVFIPDGIREIRGVFIHQHGCGMQGHGAATAYDIQYQAFAKKWHLAVIGPDLYPKPGSPRCTDSWIHPVEDGSGPALLAGLDRIASFSKHPELTTVPWLLWGHSGGGYWVLAMMNTYPDRILAAVCYSPAFDPLFPYSKAATDIPVMIRHAGPGDFNNPGVNCWGTALHTFSILRNMGGLASIAYTSGQGHNLSYIRYMAIPFFESVLARRLPLNGSMELKKMDQSKAWLCDTTTTGTVQIYKASTFTGDKRAMSWLPDSTCAVKFMEYITTNTVKDITPPFSPENLKLVESGDTVMELSWQAGADIESGIRCFNIYRNDKHFARYPSTGDFQSFNTNGDDAVPVNPPPMSYRFPADGINGNDTIAITTVNRFYLESSKTKIVWNNHNTDKK